VGAVNTLVKLEGIGFAYAGRPPIFDGLGFELRRGDRIGLIGANGSGKTTLFHLMMGLLTTCKGRVEAFGRTRTREKDFREVRERIGLLFQDPDDQLFCPTVGEDIAFGPLNLGKSRADVREIVEKTLDMLGLRGFEDRVTHNLSGGEKRLVSLATVLAMGPEVLLLDEPTNGLDETVTERVMQVLNRLDISLVIASHNRDFLAETTRLTYRLKDGELYDLRE
jgi:cobalt/nickel transport system ATP-binding protein